MLFTVTYVLALAGAASAGVIDTAACDGKGACVNTSQCHFKFIAEKSTDEAAYTCGNAGIVNKQQEASISLGFRSGISGLTTVSRADFPVCDIVQPGSKSVLLKQVTNDITAFAFIDYNCALAVPNAGDCWRGDKRDQNAGSAIICKVLRGGTACETTTKELWSQSTCPAN